ncbi:hypothetical protein V6N12_019414 [Hibiscus sabdariffa]|uniref:LOB domain-containing protein n=1 Tax=Hibiscus sabdariffa TaxID=183260 RepID=A0ABR2BMB2_9ROSI
MGGNSPCASCKLLRRRCAKDCIFAPYFPSDDPHKFAIVHKELPVQQRADAVSSLVYEANARVRDPVYGCVGAISYLQNQVSQLQTQLAVARAEIVCIQMQQDPIVPTSPQILLDQAVDDKSFLLHNHYFNFANSPSSTNVNFHDSLKRETIFGDSLS